MAEEKGEILIYSSDDGVTKIDVRLEDETVWLTQQQLADLYHTSKSNVSEHITNIFKEGELDEAATVRKFRTVQIEGGRNVDRNLLHYNLDMIISLGYRITSMTATKFRQWATLTDYDKMRDKLVMEVVSGETKKDLLETVPHKDIEDMGEVLAEMMGIEQAEMMGLYPVRPEDEQIFVASVHQQLNRNANIIKNHSFFWNALR